MKYLSNLTCPPHFGWGLSSLKVLVSESGDQTREPAARLKEVLAALKEAKRELSAALDSEAAMNQLLADAKQAVRNQDFPEVRLLETPSHQEMVKKYEWRQAVMKKIRGLTEEADFQLQLLALQSKEVGELMKSLYRIETNPSDPHQLTFSIALIEKALSHANEHRVARHRTVKHGHRNPDTDRIRNRVGEVYAEAARENERCDRAAICRRLDTKQIPLPESTIWGRRYKTWQEALKTNRGTVSTWLTRAKSSSK